MGIANGDKHRQKGDDEKNNLEEHPESIGRDHVVEGMLRGTNKG